MQLKKQVTKLESVIFSLQEGNKVTQQQIDLLNREARQAKEQYELDIKQAKEQVQQISQSHSQDDHRVQDLEQENKKLRRDAGWLRTQREQMRKGIQVEQRDGNATSINYPFSTVIDIVHSTLGSHGYTILARMKTDQKAVFITDRKTSRPTSLEVAGFRNQYILSVEKQSSQNSSLWVKADFEKFTQRGQILDASKHEIKEIELRLIQEIQETLKQKGVGSKPHEKS